jgi:hypothetical protein
MAQVLIHPVATLVNRWEGATWTGTSWRVLVPRPSWPRWFMPQHHRVWSRRTPHVVAPLALTSAHPEVPMRWGLVRSLVWLSPTWP